MSKFKVGDWVKIVGVSEDKMRLLILEAISVTCETGTQNHYKCRPYLNNDNDRTYHKSGWGHGTKEEIVREMEIEKKVKNPEDKK